MTSFCSGKKRTQMRKAALHEKSRDPRTGGATYLCRSARARARMRKALDLPAIGSPTIMRPCRT